MSFAETCGGARSFGRGRRHRTNCRLLCQTFLTFTLLFDDLSFRLFGQLLLLIIFPEISKKVSKSVGTFLNVQTIRHQVLLSTDVHIWFDFGLSRETTDQRSGELRLLSDRLDVLSYLGRQRRLGLLRDDEGVRPRSRRST